MKRVLKMRKIKPGFYARLFHSKGIGYVIETNESREGWVSLVYAGDEDGLVPPFNSCKSPIDWFNKVFEVIKKW